MPAPVVDDWQSYTKKDVINETTTDHLVRVLVAEGIQSPRLEVDMTCDSALKAVSAKLKSEAPFTWRESTGDFVAKGMLGAAGISSNITSTLVQWRMGNAIQRDYVRRGQYNNVVVIEKFFDLKNTAAWPGSLALSLSTQSGPIDVETSLATRQASTFLEHCKSNIYQAEVAKAEREAPARAAAKAASNALHERVQRAESRAEKLASEPSTSAEWEKWLGLVQARVGAPIILDIPNDFNHEHDCSVLLTQTPRGEVTRVQTLHCNSRHIIVSTLEQGVRESSPLPVPPASIFLDEFVLDIGLGAGTSP